MDAVKYFEERERLLNSLGRKESLCMGVYCYDCPFHTNTHCIVQRIESVEIVEKWSAEHPQKTILQDFLEKYPNAIMRKENDPCSCAQFLGYVKDCKRPCEDCWNTPLEG